MRTSDRRMSRQRERSAADWRSARRRRAREDLRVGDDRGLEVVTNTLGPGEAGEMRCRNLDVLQETRDASVDLANDVAMQVDGVSRTAVALE